MSRKLLRPRFFLLLVASVITTRIVVPLIDEAVPEVGAFVPLPDPCQAELDRLNDATSAVGAAEDVLGDAETIQAQAEQAFYECEFNTPGMCAMEEDDLQAADELVAQAEMAVETAQADLIAAQYEYDECTNSGGQRSEYRLAED